MIEQIILFIVFFIFAGTTVFRLFQIRPQDLCFADGVLVGLTYYMMVPVFLILCEGELHGGTIQAPPFVPTQDVTTMMAIFIGWATVLSAHWLITEQNRQRSFGSALGGGPLAGPAGPFPAGPFPGGPFPAGPLAPPPGNGAVRPPFDPLRRLPVGPLVNRSRGEALRRNIFVIFCLYLVCQTYVFVQSGFLSADSHWYTSLDYAFENSTAFIAIKNFANTYRAVFFGLLILCAELRIINRSTAVILGGALCLVDVSTTFNRIVILYYYVSLFILFRRWLVVNLAITIILIPTVALVSNMWTLYRALALRDGFNVQSFLQALEDTARFQGEYAGLSFLESLNGIFESSNLVVFNFVVKNTGGEVPIFWGYTYLLRPFTSFIPSTIWPDKPLVFAVYLGEIINGRFGLSLSTSLFGEVFANFPYIWPVVLFLTILFVNWIYRQADRFVAGAAAMSFFVAIALWRFDMNFAAVSLYALVLVFLANKAIDFFRGPVGQRVTP